MDTFHIGIPGLVQASNKGVFQEVGRVRAATTYLVVVCDANGTYLSGPVLIDEAMMSGHLGTIQ